jgi:hypothetical protein
MVAGLAGLSGVNVQALWPMIASGYWPATPETVAAYFRSAHPDPFACGRLPSHPFPSMALIAFVAENCKLRTQKAVQTACYFGGLHLCPGGREFGR